MGGAVGAVSTLHATNGMVCSVDHLASSAGLAMLRAGGSAADAAIATSAVLAVTTQHMCGMGGDLFALVSQDGQPPAALCSAGRAGSGSDADRLRAEGHTRMPFRGDIRTVTVPGCVDGWLTLHERFGRLPIATVLAPAIGYAASGFAVAPLLALMAPMVDQVPGAEAYVGARTGDRMCRPGVAAALESIAREGRSGFYEGAFGSGLRALGAGLFSEADLTTSQATWLEPIGRDVWDHEVWTVPPPSQGYLTVAAAWIAQGLMLPDDPDDGGWAHLLVESARQAGRDRLAVLHDRADGEALLDEVDLARRRAAIDPDHSGAPSTPTEGGGTIYLCAVDADGIGVSLIQSNASGFGAHIFEPATGISLQNRGLGFSLEPGHPAELAPGRQPPHTLSPALVTRGGRLRAVVGTMGGDSQPQVVLQLLARMLRNGQDPGAVISAPRWVLGDGGFAVWGGDGPAFVRLEAGAPAGWFDGLASRGHQIQAVDGFHGFGHAHLIERDEDGVLHGASDPRALTGAAAGY
jgi:gamma-glutamyltranspeptidase/glutathione hydrolase